MAQNRSSNRLRLEPNGDNLVDSSFAILEMRRARVLLGLVFSIIISSELLLSQLFVRVSSE